MVTPLTSYGISSDHFLRSRLRNQQIAPFFSSSSITPLSHLFTDKIIYLYYQDDKCVGKVKLRKNWNRYAYIEDIAVCKDFRGQGIGSALINISIEWAKHKNLHGLMLETQDNNLIACKFYHNCGFKIGSVDTMLYANFENNFEKAVFWYLRF